LALRHEINLQTKAVRGQQEQNAETLRRLAQAVESLDKAQAAAEDAAAETTDEPLRPLLKTLLDVFDALTVAAREVRRVTESILPDLEQLLPAPAAPRRASLWGRLFRRGSSAAHPNPATAREHAGQTIPRIRSMLGSLLAGYTMSLQRVERTLQKHELEPIDCMGAAFETEEMEVVEVVAGSGRPAGEVVEEVRRGYLWRGRVFRYAQVRVAKDQV
jgi:molecular chaperone GrpE